MAWQVQEAKQKFSEVVRRARSEGPQVVTRHGEDVVVVISVEEFKRLGGEQQKPKMDFKEFLLSMPYFDDLDMELDQAPIEAADFGDDR